MKCAMYEVCDAKMRKKSWPEEANGVVRRRQAVERGRKIAFSGSQTRIRQKR